MIAGGQSYLLVEGASSYTSSWKAGQDTCSPSPGAVPPAPRGGPLGRSERLHDSVSLNDSRHFGLVSSFLTAHPSTVLPSHFHTQLFPSWLS